LPRPGEVAVKHCASCSLWRHEADRLNAECDLLREQLHRLGVKPEVVRDGNEAGYLSPRNAA
jgi:hypothetical protein